MSRYAEDAGQAMIDRLEKQTLRISWLEEELQLATKERDALRRLLRDSITVTEEHLPGPTARRVSIDVPIAEGLIANEAERAFVLRELNRSIADEVIAALEHRPGKLLRTILDPRKRW